MRKSQYLAKKQAREEWGELSEYSPILNRHSKEATAREPKGHQEQMECAEGQEFSNHIGLICKIHTRIGSSFQSRFTED